MNHRDWTWCGVCYDTTELFPFSFCENCWVKHGMPKAMDMTQYPKAQEMIDDER